MLKYSTGRVVIIILLLFPSGAKATDVATPVQYTAVDGGGIRIYSGFGHI